MAGFEELPDEQKLNLARFAHTLIHRNPDIAREARKLAKKANPDLRFPEIEAEERVNEQLKSRDKQIEEMQQQLMTQDVERRREAQRQSCRDKGLDPDEVEELIVERGKLGRTIQYEDAMELLKLQKQIAAASGPGGDGARPNRSITPDIMNDKDLWQNPEKTANERTIAAIDELNAMRSKRARA